MKSFNVIIYDFNHKCFRPYNIMPYLLKQYNEAEHKPKTIEEISDFIEKEAMYQWWSRCEYEILISDWPNQEITKKIDIYEQVKMNIDLIVELFINNIQNGTKLA